MSDDELHPTDEDRRKHLDYIQAVITRMSSASTTTKGWLLPIVVATYGYALTAGEAGVALLGVVGVALFSLMDANYLDQERAFRDLYDRVARLKEGDPVPPFAMNPSWAAPSDPATVTAVHPDQIHRPAPASDRAGQPYPPRRHLATRMWAAIKHWFPDGTVWSSWAIAPFYGPLALLGFAVFALAL